MGAILANTPLANTAGYTGGTPHVVEEVTTPIVHISSDVGDLGSMLFGHGIEHAVATGLTDTPASFGPAGGFVNPFHLQEAATTDTEATPVGSSGYTPPVKSSVSVADFTGKVRSDLSRVGTMISERLPKVTNG